MDLLVFAIVSVCLFINQFMSNKAQYEACNRVFWDVNSRISGFRRDFTDFKIKQEALEARIVAVTEANRNLRKRLHELENK
jgi:hypothetical protein